MNTNESMPEVERPVTESAVSIYGSNDAMDDFPVLKAFQQYIDAEQAKARKRLVMLCSFFGVLMICVIAVFVILLIIVNARNQALNDRLVEYAMKRLDAQPAGMQTPVLAVTPSGQDGSALVTLTEKITEMQQKLAEKPAQNNAAVRQGAVRQVQPNHQSTAEQMEIKRLKALLAAEKEKQAAERERQRLADLEDYRRKHYPELYEKKAEKPAAAPVQTKVVSPKVVQPEPDAHEELMKEVAQILQEGESNNSENNNSIPVVIQGSSSLWSVPND